MQDPRVDKMARVLTGYSLALKPGDLFMIQAAEVAAPLVRAVFASALAAGAHPYLKLTVDGIAEILYKNATDAQLQYISEIQKLEVSNVDAMLTVMGTQNTRNLSGVDPTRIALQKRAGLPLSQVMLERIASGELRWCGTQFPTHSAAQDADMSLAEYEEFLFKACALDKENPGEHWGNLEAEQERIIDFLKGSKTIRVRAVDTDLEFKVEGRRWINCAGRENFPDGEIFTGPIEDSVNGQIRFTYPACYHNREVEDVKLTFEDGQVVRVEAGKGLDFLRSMLETDDGASYVGEFAFGTNKGITRFTKNTLFDEKVGGTVHLAMGASLPESGGKNKSGIHWDMVCDLRAGGEVSTDGETFYRDGDFLI